MITRFIGACAVAGLLFTSCTQDNTLVSTVDAPVSEFPEIDPYTTPESLPDNGLPEEIVTFYDQDHPEDHVTTVTNLDGTVSEVYSVDGCTTMTPEHYKEWKSLGMDANDKQYHAYNTVTRRNRTIRVLGWDANTSFGLTRTAKTGLRYAVNNWNNEVNIRYNFELSFGTDQSNADIVVFREETNARLGYADYPSNGNPGRFVRIASAADGMNSQDLEQISCHEIGHAMGFRHSNWQDRNCGETGSRDTEARDPRGAVFIRGTDFFTTDSWMKACFSIGRDDGEFRGKDKIAIEYLY